MVRGWDLFTAHFADVSDEIVLIGGMAATLAMREQQIPFRATKDLDLVLSGVSNSAALGARFWEFIDAGGYRTRARNDGTPILYRFVSPSDDRYPSIIELFTASTIEPSTTTSVAMRVQFDASISPASALVMDPSVLAFVLSSERRIDDAIRFARVDRLIPLKALAWSDLVARRSRGESVDSSDIKKHRNDCCRLSQLLIPGTTVATPDVCRAALQQLTDSVAEDDTLNLASLSLGKLDRSVLAQRLRDAFLGRDR